MSNFQNLLEKRRTIYQLGKDVTLSKDEITSMIKKAVSEAPSAFHSQSSRVVVLLGDEHTKVWDITEAQLRNIVPADQFEPTKARIDGFRAAFGTVLFYEDQNVVKGLQEQFPLYAANFPKWSQESTAIAQYAVWLLLAESDIGASLQHYNPLIDADVAKAYGIPESWTLHAQMPFGSIVAGAGEKSHMDEAERFKVFG